MELKYAENMIHESNLQQKRKFRLTKIEFAEVKT